MKRICEVCSSRNNKILYHQRFVLPTKYFFHSGYDVAVCNNCGFVYADNIPEQEFFEEYYKEMSKKTFYLEKKIFEKSNKDTYYDKEMNKRIKFTMPIIEKHISKKDRILDVGCYTGEMLAILKNKGYKNILGIDPSDYAVKLAKKWYGIEVITASAFDDLSIGEFDFIILAHVMEHIKDLRLFIHKVSSYLAPGGKIYIESPNADNFFISKSSKFLPEHQESFQQFSVEHINFFTKTSLANLMNSLKFKKVSLATKVSVIAILSGVWQKKPVKKDKIIEGKIRKYIKESAALLKNLTAIIDKVVKNKKKIYVWGAGVHTQRMLSLTNLIHANIVAFIDSNDSYKNGKLVNKPIMSPEALKKKSKLPILISSKGYQEAILNQIKQMRLSNEIILLYDTKN
ncbi:hypothetical protein A3A93_02750 [Candidatus Roizmanbacteria bacterium RIFCSPLOWO2_01_FULL_38_12]|uniref:C-methyltransferase domain-containing protein n=1 Tax=Candidatus Roizmanbacteria bacterium RIFCSPLOWO2_01_FULL_38_12 TaxID=1802061 RepID=A0A1F7IUM0_9BACT|nr:MAG: hypothetical protein A2861_02630 [Candidatus Roizmanbacteria bacterium RIFCSPHIGHO2_01_FULL_38_15]OGK34341.1 MAG: hypothetical protein A3F59_04855 [Candidatus Roizmanbacteria bacterium RIFCSPHIGHO2_12_FULL_38_13]OGK47016.1 MAG: hypothetical protein A3A93_02750 [Candidatus Roizmanbacteria bacterium RIFCSPLOWO2_01_FULL_38_12]